MCLGRRPNGFATSGPQTAATGLLTTELGINLKAMILKEREYNGCSCVHRLVRTSDCKKKKLRSTHNMKVQAQNVCTILDERVGQRRVLDRDGKCGLRFEI